MITPSSKRPRRLSRAQTHGDRSADSESQAGQGLAATLKGRCEDDPTLNLHSLCAPNVKPHLPWDGCSMPRPPAGFMHNRIAGMRAESKCKSRETIVF